MNNKKSNFVGSDLVMWIVAIGFTILLLGLLVWVMQNSIGPE